MIETPPGEVRGSAVTRLENGTTKDLLTPGMPFRSALIGEAVAQLRAQPLDVPVSPQVDGWPMLVTFADITKPETVRRVDLEDLAALFGEGVRNGAL